MSDISKKARDRAQALANAEIMMETASQAIRTAFARYIQQVSDAVKEVHDDYIGRALRGDPYNATLIDSQSKLAPFILPEPVDPLFSVVLAAIKDANIGVTHEKLEKLTDSLRARGMELAREQDQ